MGVSFTARIHGAGSVAKQGAGQVLGQVAANIAHPIIALVL